MAKTKTSHICGIQGLRVNRQVKNPRAVSKEGPFAIFLFFFTFWCKKIANKSVSESDFSFIDPYSAHCYFKFLKKRSQFRCTGLLYSSKLEHLDGKTLTCFIQNLVQNLMNLLLSSKSNRKWQKKVQKTTYTWYWGSKG